MSAAADVVVLSSSPDQSCSRTPQKIPYDPKKLFGFSPQLYSPESLASPSELIRNLPTPTNEPSEDTGKKSQKKTANKSTTSSSKSNRNMTKDKPKRGRKKLVDQLQTVLGDSEPSALESKDNASKKVSKPRTKRTDTEKNRGGPKNKTLTGKVSKANRAPPLSDTKAAKPSSSKSLSQKDETKELDNWETTGLQLEEATKRRLDWTPPKDGVKQPVELGSDGNEGSTQKSTPSQNFINLLSGFGFTGSMCSQSSVQTSEENGGPTKRRRIEVGATRSRSILISADISQLMDSRIASDPKPSVSDTKDNASTGEESQQPIARKKPGRPPKKPTTLTARVTARYASDYTEDKGAEITNIANTEAARGRRKIKAKPKPQKHEFIVLSPEAAVKSLEDQDFMFGTCSQLEREDSPATLRDMQTAINASELEPNPSTNQEATSGSVISRFTAPRNLWSEASRDFDGALAQAEVLDLVDGCDVSQISPRRDSNQPEVSDGKHQEIEIANDKHMDNASRKESSRPRANSVAVEQPSQQTGDNADKQKRAASATEESRPEMPRYSGLTDAELSKQLAVYGFKRVTKRQDKIALLQRCWKSKHGTNGDRQGNLPNTSTSETYKDGKSTKVLSNSRAKSKAKSTSPADNNVLAQPAARRHQGSSRPAPSSSQKPAEPPRTSQQKPDLPPQPKSFAHVEEIEDTEDELIPSPSRLQSRYMNLTDPRGQPLPISAAPPCPNSATFKTQSKQTTTIVSDSFDEDDDELPDLATQITKAVRAQPRMSTTTKGPKRPSWHEKILMYDPIVLEDFAAWLNTDGLGLIAEDREVSAAFVRGWCESKGICCCWKKERW